MEITSNISNDDHDIKGRNGGAITSSRQPVGDQLTARPSMEAPETSKRLMVSPNPQDPEAEEEIMISSVRRRLVDEEKMVVEKVQRLDLDYDLDKRTKETPATLASSTRQDVAESKDQDCANKKTTSSKVVPFGEAFDESDLPGKD